MMGFWYSALLFLPWCAALGAEDIEGLPIAASLLDVEEGEPYTTPFDEESEDVDEDMLELLLRHSHPLPTSRERRWKQDKHRESKQVVRPRPQPHRLPRVIDHA